MKNIILLIIFSCTATYTAFSQYNEFSVVVGGGINKLTQAPKDGIANWGNSFHFGLRNTFYIAPKSRIIVGLEMGFHQNDLQIKNKLIQNQMVDDEGDGFIFNQDVYGYQEKLSLNTLTIPILYSYQTAGNTSFYVNVGGKINIPMNNMNNRSSADSIKLSAYIILMYM